MTADPFKYQFVPVRMRDIDTLEGGLVAVALFDDDRPPGGLAGLVDWRMDGLISRIRVTTVYPDMQNPHYKGLALGPFGAGLAEKLLFPAGRLLPFFRILVVGMGSRKGYNSQRYKAVVEAVVGSASSLRVDKLTLRLPGWKAAGLPARRACDIFVSKLMSVKSAGEHIPGHICFVENLEHQGEMDEKIGEILDSQPRWR